jgi:hypothetical protein
MDPRCEGSPEGPATNSHERRRAGETGRGHLPQGRDRLRKGGPQSVHSEKWSVCERSEVGKRAPGRRRSEGQSTSELRTGRKAGGEAQPGAGASQSTDPCHTLFCTGHPTTCSQERIGASKMRRRHNLAKTRAAHGSGCSGSGAWRGTRRSTRDSSLRTLRGGGIEAIRGRKKAWPSTGQAR